MQQQTDRPTTHAANRRKKPSTEGATSDSATTAAEHTPAGLFSQSYVCGISIGFTMSWRMDGSNPIPRSGQPHPQPGSHICDANDRNDDKMRRRKSTGTSEGE